MGESGTLASSQSVYVCVEGVWSWEVEKGEICLWSMFTAILNLWEVSDIY